MLIIGEGKLVELRWRAKRGAEMLNEKEQREAESFVRAIERYRRQVDSLLCRTQAHQARAHHPPCEMNIPSNVRIKKATYLGDYAIRFAFSDGHASDIDFLPFLSAAGQNPMNSQYLDVTRFRDFKLHRNVDVY